MHGHVHAFAHTHMYARAYARSWTHTCTHLSTQTYTHTHNTDTHALVSMCALRTRAAQDSLEYRAAYDAVAGLRSWIAELKNASTHSILKPL